MVLLHMQPNLKRTMYMERTARSMHQLRQTTPHHTQQSCMHLHTAQFTAAASRLKQRAALSFGAARSALKPRKESPLPSGHTI